ncbi:hypothetical protein TSOC_004432 [Tetrabaena socialis]|uniref:RAP domain-containing protein n=1 Tax=Tetrabaena socialis TaxID=47790 RepID=A0A2J8A904_9CHLO|nr:hypothetical protein TSOC_004432 [Tetrabaena socialis]|eukprot:PNH08981.1 hypothetical protein TSOC_004432 [Tetrabaena socialis]
MVVEAPAAGGGAGLAGPRGPLSGDDGDPGKARDLPSLAALVHDGAAAWDVSRLCAAFNRAGKLSSPSVEHTELLHRTLATLATAYLPLLPGLWDAKSCVIPLWACAKAGYWSGGLAAALLQRLGRDDGALMRRATDQGHANLWWSVSEAPEEAGMAGRTAEVLRASAKGLLLMGDCHLGAQTCSNVLLACARLGYEDTALLHHLTSCLAAQPDATDCQALANGLYALGKLREDCGHAPRPQDLQRLAAEVVGRLPCGLQRAGSLGQEGGGSFVPQALSNMLLGCSKLGLADPDLLRPLAAAAGQAAVRMEEQHLANSLHSLAVLGCAGASYAPAVQCLAVEVQQRLQRQPDAFKPQDLSNMLYALALLGLKHPAYAPVEALAAECKRRGFTGFSAQSFANSAWALAKMGYDSDQAWFESAVAAAVRPGVAEALGSQDLSNLWYALALVRHHPTTALLESTAAASALLRTRATGQCCANLLWSLATLGVPYDPRLVGVLLERLVELLPQRGEVNGQNVANSLWALAVMGPDVLSRHRRSVEGLLREVVRRWNGGEAMAAATGSTSLDLVQLWQVQQELASADGCGELAGILAAGKGAGPQGSLTNAMRCAAEGRVDTEPSTSDLQCRVVSALGRLQQRLALEQGQEQPADARCIVSVSGEQQVEGMVGRVDVVVELAGGRQVAVEVDGPTHFLANDPHTRARNGSTQLRDRQLGRLFGAGNVASVPHWEWKGMRGDAGREEGFLLRLLGL